MGACHVAWLAWHELALRKVRGGPPGRRRGDWAFRLCLDTSSVIERGFDWVARLLFVLVALALFALAISLVVAGEAGVSAVLDIFRRDIDRVLALGGWDGIASVDRRALAMPADEARHGSPALPRPVADLARRRAGS